jgi:hypothetical protein
MNSRSTNIAGGPHGEMVPVQASIAAVREHAVLLAVGERSQLQRWIPRTLIHPDDSVLLDGAMVGQQMRLRLAQWKAAEVGFLNTRQDDAADGDLFDGRGA